MANAESRGSEPKPAIKSSPSEQKNSVRAASSKGSSSQDPNVEESCYIRSAN